jgi:hypothetical protein
MAAGRQYSYDTDGKPILTKEPKLLLNDNDAFSESSMGATTLPTASSLVRYWTVLLEFIHYSESPKSASVYLQDLYSQQASPEFKARAAEKAKQKASQ